MDKALIGLVGVVLGFFLTIFKDWLLQRTKTKKDYEYLTIRVVCVLDRFMYACVDVVNDDGTCMGQYDKDGYARIQVTPPTFNPYDLDVEWKSIPHTVMYGILNFPNKIETANHTIGSTFDYVADPPGYEEGFEERQYQYSKLGIYALELAGKLRDYGKLPSLDYSENWNPNKILSEKIVEIQKLREARGKAQMKLMSKLQNI